MTKPIIAEITLQIEEFEIVLSLDQAKELYRVLDKLVGEPEKVYIPQQPYPYIHDHYPYWRYNGPYWSVTPFNNSVGNTPIDGSYKITMLSSEPKWSDHLT